MRLPLQALRGVTVFLPLRSFGHFRPRVRRPHLPALFDLNGCIEPVIFGCEKITPLYESHQFWTADY